MNTALREALEPVLVDAFREVEVVSAERAMRRNVESDRRTTNLD